LKKYLAFAKSKDNPTLQQATCD
jgi:DNA replicative helicase MCM subunit Mcm2 (Cdc46/Mcm family)